MNSTTLLMSQVLRIFVLLIVCCAGVICGILDSAQVWRLGSSNDISTNTTAGIVLVRFSIVTITFDE